jgi:creatinine amidohydrolase
MKSSIIYNLSEVHYKNILNQRFRILLLSWGATEAHNYHLPYATDNFQVKHIALKSTELAANEGRHILILPTVPFGVNTGQLDIKFVINMNPSTQMALLRDIFCSVAPYEVEKFVILNRHGGNDFRQIIRELQAEFKNILLLEINWYKVLDAKEYFQEPGDHAGEMETSVMMHILPEFVLPLTEAGEGSNRKFRLEGLKKKWAWAQREWSEVTKDTGVGNPVTANSEKGEIFLSALCRTIADFLIELDKSPNDEMYEYNF